MAFKTKEISNFKFIIIFILTIITIIHLFIARSLDDILRFSFYIAIPMIIIYGIIFINLLLKKELKKISLGLIFFSLPIIGILAISYYALAVTINEVYNWLMSPIFTEKTQISLVLITTLILGIGFFYFRLKFRVFYGIIELTFGLLIALNKVTQLNIENLDTNLIMTYITASIYLVVRGLDNIHQGVTKEPIDKLAAKIIKYLKGA